MPDAVLPPGNRSALSGIKGNLSFHASPELYIVRSAIQYHKDHPEDVAKRRPSSTKILNRNVILISGYRHAQEVLAHEDVEEPLFVAAETYRQLMEPFFPSPNLLLSDGCPHRKMKTSWTPSEERMLVHATEQQLTTMAARYLQNLPTNIPLNLYTTMKDLAWQLLLSAYLDLCKEDAAYGKLVQLQEDLLRGQFSLLPVSVDVGMWQSPRKKGIKAREQIQSVLTERLQARKPVWLAQETHEQSSQQEVVNHLLMATSSLAVKAVASLLTAFLLNAFSYRRPDAQDQSLFHWVHSGSDEGVATRYQSILSETLRLSPPVIGVMRRATAERRLSAHHDTDSDILVPEGWDVWTYFPGANRDPDLFGDDADLFRYDRYLPGHRSPAPITFGLGSKTCLGASFVQRSAVAVLQAFGQVELGLEATVQAVGVKAWLGWETAGPEEWATDMKQLPTQRPSRPVMVQILQLT